jgi:hypothetical protein
MAMVGRLAAVAFLALGSGVTVAAADTPSPVRFVQTRTAPHAGEFWQFALGVRDDPSVTRMTLECYARVGSRQTPLRAITHTFRDESTGEIVATTCSFRIPRTTAGQRLRTVLSTKVESRDGALTRVTHGDGAVRIWKIRP